MNESTRSAWNSWSDEYFKGLSFYVGDPAADIELIKRDPIRAFPRDVREMLGVAVPDGLNGKRVLVPSSGDNLAVFGFHLLGAKVTSADLAENQLANAKKIADANGFTGIEFRQADSMTLDGIPDGEFDLVYTSNGAHVWISDLAMMYRSFYRALTLGGAYVFFETHPFHRPFNERTYDEEKVVRFVKPYTSTGPFNNPPEYAWRVQDFLQALLSAGFELRDYREIGPQDDDLYNYRWEDKAKNDWTVYPFAALPNWMCVSAVKKIEA
ncbi:MAG: methyltransferase domain-containing protein [Oscillospiraceae bacterium]|jgi:SAM-dependent methyltransferase|nr:methyltransferase domain-containing protein [Oscillospiraceae bacterium]